MQLSNPNSGKNIKCVTAFPSMHGLDVFNTGIEYTSDTIYPFQIFQTNSAADKHGDSNMVYDVDPCTEHFRCVLKPTHSTHILPPAHLKWQWPPDAR